LNERFLVLPAGRIQASSGWLMQIQIPEGDFGGYIFDLDGTLVDTMPLHYSAWEAALRRAGLVGRLDENRFYELGGVPSRKVAALLGEHHGLTLDPVVVYRDKEEAFMSSLEKLELILPVVQFARTISKTRPVSIASGGTRDVVQSTLEKTGLASLFPIVVTADDVVHGKPSPDMFLLAAKLMGVAPESCLVFEDGQPGIKAAEAAGMKHVFVPSRL
jgi:beta-phosphoglucomutase-like phosphatase (HAD superfamily)